MPATVFLVGAGPGDPGLLTVRALQLVETADVVVYDRLVSPEILALIPAGATRIDVGKQPHNHPVPQEEINRLLVKLARENRAVVRLKGGDPYLFGRGSEEAAHLAAHGVAFEIVPGITSAQGCAAAAGFPLTHRGIATGVRFLTGHCREDADLDYDWRGLADPATTLVIYMGRSNIARIAIRMMNEGMKPSTPVAVICEGTTTRQRTLFTTIGEVAGVVAAADFDGPVLFVVGGVVALASTLGPAARDTVLIDLAERRRQHG